MTHAYHSLQRGPDRLLLYTFLDSVKLPEILQHALGLQAHLRAALDEFLTELQAHWPAESQPELPDLSLQMGISQGSVQAMRLGSRRLIWGPCVESADTLRRSSGPNQILCCLAEQDLQPGPFVLRERGQARLAGEQTSRTVFQLEPPG